MCYNVLAKLRSWLSEGSPNSRTSIKSRVPDQVHDRGTSKNTLLTGIFPMQCGFSLTVSFSEISPQARVCEKQLLTSTSFGEC